MHQHIACSVFTEFAAELNHFAGRRNNFDTHNLITGYAVFDGTVAAGISRDVTADETGVPATGIACVKETFFINGVLKSCRCNTRFGNDHHVGFINFNNFIHPFNRDDNTAENSYGAGCKTGTGRTGNHDDVVIITEFNDFGNFFGGRRKDNYLCLFHIMRVRYFIMTVRVKFILIRIDILFTHDFL